MPGPLVSKSSPKKIVKAIVKKSATEMARAMTKPEKKVAAKTLLKLGWGSRQVESWLGISDNTALRSKDIETPEGLKQFEADFKAALEDMKMQGLTSVYQRIIELVPKQKNIQTLITAGEFFQGNSAKGPGTAIQFNFNSNKYVKER